MIVSDTRPILVIVYYTPDGCVTYDAPTIEEAYAIAHRENLRTDCKYVILAQLIGVVTIGAKPDANEQS